MKFALTIILAVSLGLCGCTAALPSLSSPSPSPSASALETAAPEPKPYKTAVEYLEANMGGGALAAVTEKARELLTLEIEATDNTITYKYFLSKDYKVDTNTPTEIGLALEQAAPNILKLCEEIESHVEQGSITISVKYYANNVVIMSKDFNKG